MIDPIGLFGEWAQLQNTINCHEPLQKLLRRRMRFPLKFLDAVTKIVRPRHFIIVTNYFHK